MNKKQDTFILVPNEHRLGGIRNIYESLKSHLRDVHYINRGEKFENEPKFLAPFRVLFDYLIFLKETFASEGVLVINTSLGWGGFFRDACYFLLAPRRLERVVYFHGWDKDFERRIEQSIFLKKWLRNSFLRAEHIIVLSSSFKSKLKEWGYEQAISIETTLVDENLLEGEKWEEINESRKAKESYQLLYLGSIEKDKGVWKVVKSFELIKTFQEFENIQATIAGDGEELEKLSAYGNEQALNIKFPGYVRGVKKTKAFKNAHLYVFPSNHGEGVPVSVLEAIAFGLPVVTTRVGGIPDFFEEGKMGLFLDSRDPEHIAEKVRYLLERPELMREISEYNYNYAKENFYSGRVAERLMNIIDGVRG